MYKNIGVAFIDADCLGIINNMYGYQKGDELLKAVATSLKKNFRVEDIYRIGGDEFVIICPNIKEELFLEKIANSQLYLSTTEFSASYGLVYCEMTEDLEYVVKEASIRMKKNKEKHREENPDEYSDKYKVKYKIQNM